MIRSTNTFAELWTFATAAATLPGTSPILSRCKPISRIYRNSFCEIPSSPEV
jgi:hypothetical protein